MISRPSIREACELDRDATTEEIEELLDELVQAGVMEIRVEDGKRGYHFVEAS